MLRVFCPPPWRVDRKVEDECTHHDEPPSPTHERMLSSVSDSTARPHAERTDAELQSIVSTAQAEIDQRKAERLQLQEERREFEATRKRLAETEAELDKRAAKQQRQTEVTIEVKAEVNKCNSAAELLTVVMEHKESDTDSDLNALIKILAAVKDLDDAVSSSWRAQWR